MKYKIYDILENIVVETDGYVMIVGGTKDAVFLFKKRGVTLKRMLF